MAELAERIDEVMKRYLESLDEEYRRLREELSSYADSLVSKRSGSLEPLRKRIVEMFRA